MKLSDMAAPHLQSVPGIIAALLHASVAMPLLAMLALLGQGAASAQAWPQKPVRVIVPYGAGGHTDILARIASER
ncbi:MAG: hypothetical protein Q7R45_07335, partial [Sulfuricaulis sp.]|nr:hypothetical protein [Sulfuricaulis sp.]